MAEMIRKRIGLLGVMLLALAVAFVGGGVMAEAASASISLELAGESDSVRVGDIVTVNLVLTGTERLGGFEAYLSYNASVLDYIPVDTSISGGEGLLKINDLEPFERAKSRTYVVYFEARETGGCEIAVKEKAHVYADDGGAEMSVSSNSLSIRIEPSESASDNADLASLKISPGKLMPEFGQDVTEYRTEVGAEVESLVVSAQPEDLAATVEVSGNSAFVPGENEVVVTVKAENALTKEYRITVVKEDGEAGGDDSEAGGGDTEGEQNFSLKSTNDGILFRGEYACLVTEAPAAPEGDYEPYTMVLYGKKIPAYRKAGEVGTTALLYASPDGENPGWYEFNTETKSMVQLEVRTVEKQVEVVRTEKAEPPAGLYLAVVALAVLCAVMALGLIALARKRLR